jgi:23S rRNA pseudouridine2604 synthase
MERMRINKYLSGAGYCSRRKADTLIEKGIVYINGYRAELGSVVDPGDEVRVNDDFVSIEGKQDIYLAFHKPEGVIVTADKEADNTVYDYLNGDERVIYIGRLDVNSCGLLLFTNNGDVANKLLRSEEEHEKEYVVRLNKPYTRRFLESMRDGVVIEGRITKPARIRKMNTKMFKLIITEGRNRQIRKMCEALGYEVTFLKRTRFGNVKLGDLGPGNSRMLTKTERRELLASL